jgi:peptidoglycan/LPS O-acetylase OafA/YrhL
MESASVPPQAEVPQAPPADRAAERLGRRPVLDGLRGLGVLLVICLHVGLLARGYIGVDIFFALSGFLITTLLYEEWEHTGAISLRRFYERRARRLLPALWLVVAAFIAVVLAVNPFTGLWPLGRLVATTLLFANNWVTALAPAHGQVLGPLVPTWTLAQEVQFYIAWPLALLILLRFGARPRVVLGLLALAVATLFASVPLVRHAYPAYNPYTSPLDRGAELLLGAAAAISWRTHLMPAVLRSTAAGWVCAGGLVAVLVAAAPVPEQWTCLSAAALAALLIPNLLGRRTASCRGRPSPRPRWPDGGLLTGLLGSRPLCATGKISYGLYLYHLPIYYVLWHYLPGRSPFFYAPLVFAASFAAAAVSWRVIEHRVIRGRATEPDRQRRSIATRLRPSLRTLG